MNKNARNTVTFSLDPRNLPPLTAQQREELQAVAAMPDEAIDYSDAPFRPAAVWARPVSVPSKQQVTLRLDEDVLDFFKSGGKRYQTRINAVLRAFMESQR
jgi:uncharacterized protein (DUF4415 family)